MKKVFILAIRIYRRFLSPFLGSNCRFYPSCSAYAEEAFSRKSFFQGVRLTFSRMIRCQPWHPGGFDFVE